MSWIAHSFGSIDTSCKDDRETRIVLERCAERASADQGAPIS